MKSLDGFSYSIIRSAETPVKFFYQLEVFKSMIYQGRVNLENREATEKQLASGWPAVQLTKGKRKQLAIVAMDNDPVCLTINAKKLGVHQIKVQSV